MYMLNEDKTFTRVENNPEWCNNLGESCVVGVIEEECTGCKWYREPLESTYYAENKVKWTTEDEIEFLKGVGIPEYPGFRYSTARCGDRKVCLDNYIKDKEWKDEKDNTYIPRIDWGDMDGEKVKAFARKMLRQKM